MKYIQTIKSQYDNQMKQIDVNPSVLQNLKEVIEHPKVVDDKNNIPQWKFCSVTGTKRCTENMGFTDILMLDYDDGGITIEEWERQFREYKYILHTSYSYDGIKQKFRVLLFLDKPYIIEKMFYKCSERIYSPWHILMNRFENIDPASFVKAQFFKVPALKEANAPYYCSIHDGKLFNLFSIQGYRIAYDECERKQQAYLKKLEQEYEKYRKKNGGDLTKAKEYIDKKLDSTPEGRRHNAIFGLACWWKHLGGTYSEFTSIIPGWADAQYHRQIVRLGTEWASLK